MQDICLCVCLCVCVGGNVATPQLHYKHSTVCVCLCRWDRDSSVNYIMISNYLFNNQLVGVLHSLLTCMCMHVQITHSSIFTDFDIGISVKASLGCFVSVCLVHQSAATECVYISECFFWLITDTWPLPHTSDCRGGLLVIRAQGLNDIYLSAGYDTVQIAPPTTPSDTHTCGIYIQSHTHAKVRATHKHIH